MLEITYATSSVPTTATYSYDPDGFRVKETTATTSTLSTYYPTKIYSTDGTTPTKHIFLPDGTLIATVVGTGTTTTVSYIHTDHLGGTNVATNDSGEVVQLLDYYPYGDRRLDEQSGHDEKRKFASYRFDADTGLNYLNQRYLNTSNARFLSQDPVFLAVGDPWQVRQMTRQGMWEYLSNPQNLNSYSYALNNPLVYIDSTGQSAVVSNVLRTLPITVPSLGAILTYVGGVIVSYAPPVVLGGTAAVGVAAGTKWVLSGPDSIGNQSTPTSLLKAENSGSQSDSKAQPKVKTGAEENSNPFAGPVDKPVTVVDPKGNAIPVGAGEQIKTSPDGKFLDVKGPDGKTSSGKQIHDGHPPSPRHTDPRGQQPHAHRPGVTNPDGTPWLPIK